MDKILKRMELAKTGVFGADGAEITLQMLKDVIETFEGDVPVALGHEMTKKDWFPSWGTVVRLELIEDEDGVSATLIGDVELQAVVNEAIEDGFYPSWSVSIPARAADGKHYLHHLALLGSVPPKIRDLQVVATVGEVPKNAVNASGEGTDFADYAFYHESDFKKPVTKKPAGKKSVQKTAEEQHNFSDEDRILLLKAEARAQKSHKEATRAKLRAAVGEKLPAGKLGLLDEFSDLISEAHDYEFSDQEKPEGRSIADIFTELFLLAGGKGVVQTGRKTEFSEADPLSGSVYVDAKKMAMKL